MSVHKTQHSLCKTAIIILIIFEMIQSKYTRFVPDIPQWAFRVDILYINGIKYIQ